MGAAAEPARRPWLWALLVGVLLHVPGLATGYFADDFTHRWILAGEDYGAHLAPWALYDFGEADDFRASADGLGGVPWWVGDDWKVRFFRPVASVQLWLEDVLVGGSALGHALGGLALWVLLLAALARLGARLGLPPIAVALALLFFACDESTHLPVAWTANRNSLLEALFGVLALAAVVGPRVTARDALVATALAALAAGSKESGVLFLGLVALRCCAAGGAARRVAAVPALALGGFCALWLAGGYGASSLFYPLPWAEPWVVADRAALLVVLGPMGLVGPAALDLVVFHAGLAGLESPLLAAGCIVLLAGCGLALIGLALDARRTPHVGLLATWFVLALLGQTSAPTSDRLLFVPAIPFALAAASFVVRRWSARGWRPVAALVLLLAIPVSGTSTVLRQLAVAAAAAEARDLSAELARLAPEGGDVVLLTLPNALAGLSLGPAVRLAGGSEELRPWPLKFGRGGGRLERLGPHRVRITGAVRPFLSNALERVFATFDARPSADPPTEHRVGPLTVRPRGSLGRGAGRDGIAAFAAVEVEVDPGAERVVWAAWVDGRLQALELPPVGGAVEVPDAVSRAPLAP